MSPIWIKKTKMVMCRCRLWKPLDLNSHMKWKKRKRMKHVWMETVMSRYRMMQILIETV